MKTNNSSKLPKTITSNLILLFILGLITGCYDSSVTSPALDLENSEVTALQSISAGTEIRITNDLNASQIHPAIDGNRIVWQDNRNGNFDIFLFDLSNKNETQITTDPNNQVDPAIDGKRIVWSDDRDVVSKNIYMFDLSDMSETQITDTEAPFDEVTPEISGERIMWISWRNEISVYNLNSGDLTQVGFYNAPKGGYDISGDRVVISEYNAATRDIRLYEIGADSYNWITSDQTVYHINPSIDGNRIVWQDDRHGNWNIFLYDLSTNTETQITSNSSDQTHPVISGNYIVWVDNRNGNDDIYYFDLKNKTEHQVTMDSGNQTLPDISGNRIVWQDDRNGEWDIYYYEIPSREEVVSKGFTNGNGFIDTPSGAYTADESKTGRAKFGLNARTNKGGELQGKATFIFEGGNLNFESTSFDQLLISDNTARLKGKGQVNGSGEYAFVISVVDEKSTGRDRIADKYRLRIWDPASSHVIYDNQLGDPDDARAAQSITNGNILVKDQS